MRFFAYTLGDESVPPPPPNPQLMEEMAALVEEASRAGVMVATGGLAPTSEGVKVRLANGQFTVTDGPFAEAKEIIGGWALMETATKEEAIEWTKRYLSILGAGESRIRRVMDGPEG